VNNPCPFCCAEAGPAASFYAVYSPLAFSIW
jgi:hypothetical protein